VRSEVKTQITRAEKLIVTGEAEKAREAVAAAVAVLDRAAEKGILHPNNTARRKSRLVRKLNQAQLADSAQTGPEK
jgi:small subunit ribosomal protein S20